MEIRIGRTTKACALSGRSFNHGEEIMSRVRYVERQLVREDYAPEAWSGSLADDAAAVWKTVYQDPSAMNEAEQEALSPLRRIFYEAAASKERVEIAVAFLGAQLLRRQRAFRLLKEFDDPETGARVALFTDKSGGRLVEAPDPQLTFSELEHGRRLLLERIYALENPRQEAPINEQTRTEEAGRKTGS